MVGETDPFYRSVSEYYDKDAGMNFEARAEVNPLLGRIRDDFRNITVRYPFGHALEIGCGPGFDVEWFASRFPDSKVTGIDISENMVNLARNRISAAGLANARIIRMDERGIPDQFGAAAFDLIYVYFGALNTVADLSQAAERIHEALAPGGHAVLTFVNKWYWREMLVQSLKLNFKVAFARLKRDWGGYSPDRHLASRCYSPAEIRKASENSAWRKGKATAYFTLPGIITENG